MGLSSLIIFGKFGEKGHGRQDTKARFFFPPGFLGALFSPLPLPHSFPYPSSFHSPVERKGRKRVGKTELENGAGVPLLPPLRECEKAKDGRSVSRQLQMLGMGGPPLFFGPHQLLNCESRSLAACVYGSFSTFLKDVILQYAQLRSHNCETL